MRIPLNGITRLFPFSTAKFSRPAWPAAAIALCTLAAVTGDRNYAQYTPSSGAVAPAVAPAADAKPAKPAFKQEELDQMFAPVALFPDPLLTQVLMASTYPVEVVQADRWVKQNPTLSGDALAKALEAQTWDPSVKSLVNFPDVLSSMSDKLDWTIRMGDAFLADSARVMATIQGLRAKAQAQGNLVSNEQQKIIIQQAPATQTQIIVIEPAQPNIIYVPSYSPTVVYGTWWYPTYPPPVYYPPPPYVAHNAVVFGAGLACGLAWGYAWGHSDWNHGNVNINYNQNTNINRNIDRSKYQNNVGINGGDGRWQHDASHRQGAAYRDQTTADRFGGASNRQAVQTRDQFRGRADTGRQELGSSGAGMNNRPAGGVGSGGGLGNAGASASPRPSPGVGSGNAGASASPRPAGGTGSGFGSGNAAATPRPSSPSVSDRSTPSSSGSAFNNMNSGSAARAQSQRGQSSRSSSPSPAARPSSSGASRSGGSGGGGGSRGGGGGRR